MTVPPALYASTSSDSADAEAAGAKSGTNAAANKMVTRKKADVERGSDIDDTSGIRITA
jgi:hypothetical protein